MPIVRSRRQIAQTASISAPVGGLNARDSIANMPPQDAVVLDNLFPSPSNVSLRNGKQSWATGLPAAVNTLASFSQASGSRKLFAASGGKIFDVTLSGTVGAAAVSGLSSDWWQFINFGAAGGQYLVMVNGLDGPQIFNGTAWQTITNSSTPIAITGVNPANFVHVQEFMGRLFFVEANSMRAWYLPLGSVGGAAQQLDFSSFTRLGGYLMAMMTWTIDNSSGMQQIAAFITSEGEVLLYQGNDPSYASSWYSIGGFRIGRPVGRRCFVKIGADVGVLTADGLFPLSKALLTDRSQRQDAISDKITNLINSDVQAYAANQGWQAILHPIGNKLIVNVPNTSGTYQYVMNTIHGAWCRFTGWSANCWELMGDSLFYGGQGVVYWADTGNADDGAAINAVAVQAPNYFGTRQQKQFTMGRPVLSSNAAIRPAFQINADFSVAPPSSLSSFSSGAFTYLPAPWGSLWSSSAQIYKDWQGVSTIGFSGSPAMAFSVKNASVTWQSTDVTFINGDPL